MVDKVESLCDQSSIAILVNHQLRNLLIFFSILFLNLGHSLNIYSWAQINKKRIKENCVSCTASGDRKAAIIW